MTRVLISENISFTQYFLDLHIIRHSRINVDHLLVIVHDSHIVRRPKPVSHRFRYDRVQTNPVIIVEPAFRRELRHCFELNSGKELLHKARFQTSHIQKSKDFQREPSCIVHGTCLE